MVTSHYETNLANVFAIGDVPIPSRSTISGAVGSGATAAKVIASFEQALTLMSDELWATNFSLSDVEFTQLTRQAEAIGHDLLLGR